MEEMEEKYALRQGVRGVEGLGFPSWCEPFAEQFERSSARRKVPSVRPCLV